MTNGRTETHTTFIISPASDNTRVYLSRLGLQVILRLAQKPRKNACVWRRVGFGWPYDSWRLSQRRRLRGPYPLAFGALSRRASAIVLLDGGWSCQEVAKALLFDDDTIRGWHGLFERSALEGLTAFDVGGSSGINKLKSSHGFAGVAVEV
jgi:hypothetical protein